MAETRKKDGSRYPPKTIYLLLSGLLRHMRTHNPACLNFLDTENKDFLKLHTAVDNVFRQLRSDGVGSSSKRAEIFTKEEECQLWEKGALGTSTPKVLLRTVFFLNGKNFCLRGGDEHRSLKFSQIKKVGDHYVYTENASKNRSGGFAQMRVTNKVVPIFPNPKVGERCHVYILDLYYSKLSPTAFERDNFYLQPLQNTPVHPKPWFSISPVGRNTLIKMVRDICKEGEVGGKKTNHSLRASELFQAGIPEKVIQERTGHLSLTGLRHYERVTDDQQRVASNVLSSTNTKLEKSISRPLQPISNSMPFSSNMNFSGCSVNIYQAPAALPIKPAGFSMLETADYCLSKEELDSFNEF